MTTWTAPDVASLRGDNSRPLQKIFGSLTEYLKHFETTIIDEVISQSSETFVRNGEATTLTVGTVVYLDAQQGDRATVKRAFNTSDATSAKTLGVVAETIPPNSDGLVTTLGYVYKCNTSGYTPGQTLYLGSTAGTFTATKPVAPNHMVYVGVVVRTNAGNGIIYVRCQNGYELDEIHDVLITSPTTGDILMRNGSSLWINTPQTSITSVGNITTGTWSGLFGAVSGANLTSLNATNLSSGTVASARISGSYTGITGVGTLSTGSIPTTLLTGTTLPATVVSSSLTSVGTLSALRVDGNFGIGVNGLAQMGLRISKAISGSAFAQGIYLDGAIQPSVTSRADMIWTAGSVAAAVTVPTINQFYATLSGVGLGSTVTTSSGFVAESNIGNPYSGTITNAYGFVGNLNTLAGFTRYNLFMNGSAPNFLNGNLGIGVGAPTEKLDVAGNIALTGSVIFEGATANAFETTLSVTDPTADRTITLPNVDGTAITTGNLSSITSVGTLTGLTVTGQVDLNRGSLGTTIGSSITFLNPNATTSNGDSLLHTINRLSNTTTDWSSAVWKLQRYVDTTYMGFIQFGDGVGTGSVHTVQLGINATTYLKVSSTATNVTGLLTTDNIWNTSAGTATMTGFQYVVRSTSGFPSYYYFTSMREGKRNIMSITDSGSLIDQLNPVTYQAKITDDDDEVSASWKDKDLEYGFIAEEVAEVGTGFLAQYMDDGEGNLKPAGWKFHGVVSVLVAEVQDLRSRLKALEGAK